MCRAMPHCILLRPADMAETSACYTAAFTGPSRPAVVCLARQPSALIEGTDFEGTLKGAYTVKAADNPKLLIIWTGTELAIGVDVAARLPFPVCVVSMPCMELFAEQPLEYQRSVLPRGIPAISIEAGGAQGWEKYSHKHFGVPDFGVSAPAPKCYEHFGLTAENIAAEAQKVVTFYEGRLAPDLLDRP